MRTRIVFGCLFVLLPVEEYGYDAIFFILLSLCFAWGGDTCAYFAGRAFGKHKLCPVVSPKKTVEGAIGGVLGTMVCGVAVTLVYSIAADRMEAFTRSNIGVSMYVVIALLACVAAVLGIYGDLFASVVKRQRGIQLGGGIGVRHTDVFRVKFLDLLQNLIHMTVGRQTEDLIALCADDIQTLRADGTGGAQKRNFFRHRVSS